MKGCSAIKTSIYFSKGKGKGVSTKMDGTVFRRGAPVIGEHRGELKGAKNYVISRSPKKEW